MIKTYHTENSIYEFDEENKLYRRLSKTKQEIRSHRLVYDEWLPLKSYEVVNNGEGHQALHIKAEDSVIGIITSDLVKQP